MHSLVSAVVVLAHPPPLHVLVRVWVPPPQVTEQLLNSLHAPTERKSSTAKSNIFKTKGYRFCR